MEVVRHEQPSMKEVQPLCTRGIILGPSGSGKGVLLQWLITQAYRFPAVKRVYVWSPSVELAPEWEVVRRYSKEVLGVDQEKERTFFSEFRGEDLKEEPKLMPDRRLWVRAGRANLKVLC